MSFKIGEGDMFTFTEKDVASWQVRLSLLCQSCPVFSRHPDFCPMKELAALKPGDQIDFIKSLPADALRYVLARHEICQEVEVERLLHGALVSSC